VLEFSKLLPVCCPFHHHLYLPLFGLLLNFLALFNIYFFKTPLLSGVVSTFVRFYINPCKVKVMIKYLQDGLSTVVTKEDFHFSAHGFPYDRIQLLHFGFMLFCFSKSSLFLARRAVKVSAGNKVDLCWLIIGTAEARNGPKANNLKVCFFHDFYS